MKAEWKSFQSYGKSARSVSPQLCSAQSPEKGFWLLQERWAPPEAWQDQGLAFLSVSGDVESCLLRPTELRTRSHWCALRNCGSLAGDPSACAVDFIHSAQKALVLTTRYKIQWQQSHEGVDSY